MFTRPIFQTAKANNDIDSVQVDLEISFRVVYALINIEKKVVGQVQVGNFTTRVGIMPDEFEDYIAAHQIIHTALISAISPVPATGLGPLVSSLIKDMKHLSKYMTSRKGIMLLRVDATTYYLHRLDELSPFRGILEDPIEDLKLVRAVDDYSIIVESSPLTKRKRDENDDICNICLATPSSLFTVHHQQMHFRLQFLSGVCP